MNTPAHVVVGLLAIPNRRDDVLLFIAICVGSVLPDLPMILFYGYERLILGTSESVIWGERYFDPRWQNFFDCFNSIPLILLAMLGAYAARMPRMVGLLIAMLIHTLCDLPVHHDDGHRHFFPLSDWRFESPVSYWDPNHHGTWFLRFEMVLVIAGSVWMFWRSNKRALRVCYALLGVSYLAFGLYATLVWSAAL